MENSIEQMQDLIVELQTLVSDFDLDVHSDDGNEMKVEAMRALLDNLQSEAESLVP